MIAIRKSEDRGHFHQDWLDSHHTFSFDTYHDPRHMNFRSLRVINEDRVSPERGFPMHPHSNMEILTFIVSGELQHQDSLGSRETIHAGEVQRISAGRGIRHSEANPSSDQEVHLLQIWIYPEKNDLEPGYEQRRFSSTGKGQTGLRLIGSHDGHDGSVLIHQDVSLYAGELDAGQGIDYRLETGRHAWLQVIEGTLSLNGKRLEAGDGAAVSNEQLLHAEAQTQSQFLLFDLN